MAIETCFMGDVCEEGEEMSELHQMSVHALTEKLEKAEKELAVAVIENADLRERLSSLENLYRVRDKDCAAKEEELERVRALPSKWREDGEKEEGDGEMGAAIACWCCANELEAALASPAAEPATDTDVGTKTQQLDIEDQIREAGHD